MAAASQGTYINPMAALATQISHAALNGELLTVLWLFINKEYSFAESGGRAQLLSP